MKVKKPSVQKIKPMLQRKQARTQRIKPIIDYEEEKEETRYSKEYEDQEERNISDLQDRDVYTEDGIMSRLDDETIDDSESGFMMGYLAA